MTPSHSSRFTRAARVVSFGGFPEAKEHSTLRIILIGVTLILVLRFRPRGLMPEERFRME